MSTELTKQDIQTSNDTYSEAIMGEGKPDMIMGPAWVMRDLGLDIPANIPDDQCIIMTSAGWEVTQ